MVAGKRRGQQSEQDRDATAPQPPEAADRKAGSQGIVRDQRGQEQPADKERAQRVSKGDQG